MALSSAISSVISSNLANSFPNASIWKKKNSVATRKAVATANLVVKGQNDDGTQKILNNNFSPLLRATTAVSRTPSLVGECAGKSGRGVPLFSKGSATPWPMMHDDDGLSFSRGADNDIDNGVDNDIDNDADIEIDNGADIEIDNGADIVVDKEYRLFEMVPGVIAIGCLCYLGKSSSPIEKIFLGYCITIIAVQGNAKRVNCMKISMPLSSGHQPEKSLASEMFLGPITDRFPILNILLHWLLQFGLILRSIAEPLEKLTNAIQQTRILISVFHGLFKAAWSLLRRLLEFWKQHKH